MEVVFGGGGGGGGAGAANDWRSQIWEETRESHISTLSEALMLALPPDEPDTLTDLLDVAIRSESIIFRIAVDEHDYDKKMCNKSCYFEDMPSDDHFEDISSDDHFVDISSDEHFEEISSDDHFEDISLDDQIFEPSTGALLPGVFSDRQSQIIQAQSNLQGVLSSGNTEAIRSESILFTIAVDEDDYDINMYNKSCYFEDMSSDNPFEDISSDDHFVDISSDDHFEDISSDDHFEDIPLDDQIFEPSTGALLPGVFSDRQSQIIQAESNLQGVLSSGNTEATDQAPIGNEDKPCCDDRITVLHESILYHIMSFMPAKEVVRGSILFCTWWPSWTSAPCLDIDIDHFDMDRLKFYNFAKSLFEQRGNATLDTLRLHSFAIDAAKYWIDDAIRLYKVKSIDFTENTIWEAFYLDPKAINFMSSYLRSIKLTNVILDTSFFDQLRTESCPSLENLQLADSTLDFPEISSGSLKTLEIINCLIINRLLIRTHKLVSLRFKDSRCGCSPRHIVRTTSAVILCDLSNTKSIELSAPVRQVALGRMTPRRQMFTSLKSLILGEWCFSNNFAPLVCFLKHSPMLENLDLKLKYDNCKDEKQPIHMANGIPFEAERLKKVTIHCAEKEDRLPMLKAILRANARSVEHIEVKPYT